MKKLIYILFFAFFSISQLSASNYYEFSPKLKDAYKKAVSLRFAEARKLTREVKTEEPENVLVHYVENYIDFLKIYLDEDYEEFSRLEKNKSHRLEKLSSGNSDSPYHLYTQAEVRLQWAVARSKFEEYRTAAFEVRKAFQFLERNNKKFPNFVANKKSLGILHSLIGSIPPNYKWVATLAGMSGTIEQGRREIEEVVHYAEHNDFIFEEETIIMYALMVLHIGNAGEEAWQIIRSNSLDPNTNPLASFAQASVAMHTGKTDDAIKILSKAPKGNQFHQFHYLEYMMGLCKLYKQDPDAEYHLKNYVNNFNGWNYIKESYQLLAWQELINGNKSGYLSYMQKVLTKGKASIDPDKKALKAAKSGIIPHPELTKARLQFDGGYTFEALSTMENIDISSFDNDKDLLEYHYRKGRVLQSRFQYTEAIEEFNKTIEKGNNKTYYFICNAALQAGIVKEAQKEYTAARIYFNKCLSMDSDKYESSIHGKAKTGLNRIKNK